MPTSELERDELDQERTHLARSRAQLARMRERTASMDPAGAADWVSKEYLQSTFELRMRQLQDDPNVPLFFGRLDYGGGDSFHIGRRHVSEPGGEPMVVDWRAPVSLPFYRATRHEPMGVGLRRRYGYQHGVLTAYEDEDLAAGGPDDEYSAILEAEIERPRVGPMRDIVATIQPEQDVIVRADVSRSIAVQGAPGTGKTAVGLHRAAYLLYAHREQLRRQGVLVVGPNESFLRYIRDVLPALGEVEAGQTTIEALVGKSLAALNARWTIRGHDDPGVATLKGDARLAQVLARAVWAHVGTPQDGAPHEGLVVPRGARRFRVAAYETEEILADLRTRGVRYGAARAMLPQALAHRILVKMELAGDSPDDRVQNAVARSRPVKEYAAALWPAVEPAKVVHRLLSDAGALATAAEGILTADEQAALLWERPKASPGTTAWSLADAVLLDEATDLVERTPSLGHIVVDEAQDLSPMMLRAIGRRSSTGSVTVLGDLAQATTPWATRSWDEALAHLGKPQAHVEELTRGFRVPGEVIEYAARLLPHIAATLAPPTSVRRSRGELSLVESTDLAREVVAALEREGSVGLIVPDARLAEAERAVADLPHVVLGRDVTGPFSSGSPLETEFDTRLDLVPASLAKGLEFDHVVLLDPEGIVGGEPDRVTGLRRLYVCLTRAVTSLVVLHTGPLPAELAG